MLKHNAGRLAVAGLTVLILFSPGLAKKKPKAPVKEAVDIDKVQGAEFMGDYAGTRTLTDGKKVPAVAQVLATGDGNRRSQNT